MKVHSIQDLSNTRLINFLKKNLEKISDEKLLPNYHPDFSDVPGNLFYILKEGRYKTGNYFIMEEDKKYFGSAGWNDYDGIALMLTRAYIPKEYRGQTNMSKYLLPVMFEETKDYKKLWMTFNEYNFSLYQGFVRQAQGRTNIFWPDIYKKFIPIGKRTVYYTEQYVAECNRE